MFSDMSRPQDEEVRRIPRKKSAFPKPIQAHTSICKKWLCGRACVDECVCVFVGALHVL